MRVDHISQDVAESIVFVRLLLNRKKKDREGRYEETKETVTCTGHYTNQALRTLKRMQNKAVEWKLLRDIPKFRLSKAPGRDRMIDERAEDDLEQADTNVCGGSERVPVTSGPIAVVPLAGSRRAILRIHPSISSHKPNGPINPMTWRGRYSSSAARANGHILHMSVTSSQPTLCIRMAV